MDEEGTAMLKFTIAWYHHRRASM